MSKIAETNKEQTNNPLKTVVYNSIRPILIVILIIAIILIILVVSVWYILDEDGKWKDEEVGRPSTYTGNVNISSSSGITVNRQQILIQALIDKGYTQEQIDNMTDAEIIQMLQMNEKLNRNVANLNDCTEAEIMWCLSDTYAKYLSKPEELEYLLNAEIVTQYPKIDALNNDGINGIIQFTRVGKDDDGRDTSKILKYLSPAEFDKKYNEYTSNGSLSVFDYFTLDDEGNAVIATWTQETGNFESNNTTSPYDGDDEDNPSVDSIPRINAIPTEDIIKNTYDSRYEVTSNKEDKITATYTEYTINKTPINYKNMVQNYTLPFEYLWAMLVEGRSYEFVKNLASLAYDSEIIIGIYDSEVTTTKTDSKNYTENFRMKDDVYETEEGGEETQVSEGDWEEKSYPYYERSIVTTVQDSVQIDVMYADSWIVKVQTNYQRVQSTGTPSYSPVKEDDEEWSDPGTTTTKTDTDIRTREVNDSKTDENNSGSNENNNGGGTNNNTTPGQQPSRPWQPQPVVPANPISSMSDYSINKIVRNQEYFVDEGGGGGSGSNSNGNSESESNSNSNPEEEQNNNNESENNQESEETTHIEQYTVEVKTVTTTQTKLTNRLTETRIETTYDKYEKVGNSVIDEKTSVEGNADNFVEFLRNDGTAFGLLAYSGKDWLMSVVENNQSTVNMVDLTLYLIEKAKDPDNPDLVGTFDFSIYSPTIFSDIGSLYGNTIQAKVWFALKDAGLGEIQIAAVMGNLQFESGFATNNLENSKESTLGSDQSYTDAVNNGTYSKEQFISDGAGYGLAQWTYNNRKEGLYDFAQAKGVGIDNENMQIEYLIAEILGIGDATPYANISFGEHTYNGTTYNRESWLNATDIETATTAFCISFENPKNPSESLGERITSTNTYYLEFKGREKPTGDAGELSGENLVKMQQLIQEAMSIANNDSYLYSQEKRNEPFYFDCSSLVARLYKKHFGITVPNRTASYTAENCIGEIQTAQLQIGDVVHIYAEERTPKTDSGHVAIYIGNNQIVEAYSGKIAKSDQIRITTLNKSRFKRVYRFIK